MTYTCCGWRAFGHPKREVLFFDLASLDARPQGVPELFDRGSVCHDNTTSRECQCTL